MHNKCSRQVDMSCERLHFLPMNQDFQPLYLRHICFQRTRHGIASEQLAVDSMARTLEANVPQVKRLKILIHGQEVETLAGHVDLTGRFGVDRKSVGEGRE